jgi:hypothetical protein
MCGSNEPVSGDGAGSLVGAGIALSGRHLCAARRELLRSSLERRGMECTFFVVDLFGHRGYEWCGGVRGASASRPPSGGELVVGRSAGELNGCARMVRRGRGRGALSSGAPPPPCHDMGAGDLRATIAWPAPPSLPVVKHEETGCSGSSSAALPRYGSRGSPRGAAGSYLRTLRRRMRPMEPKTRLGSHAATNGERVPLCPRARPVWMKPQ